MSNLLQVCDVGIDGLLAVIIPTKHGTYITLRNTNYIFSSFPHHTPYAAITQV